MKMYRLIFLLLLVGCKEAEIIEKEPVRRESSIGEPEQKYPWNCSEGEIEYFESLIELKDESRN